MGIICMKESDDPTTYLKISYEEFLAVLKRWEAYVWLEMKCTSRDFPAVGPRDAGQYGAPFGAEVLSPIELSELAGALWESLKEGAEEVDRIHDEAFAEAQVKHFNDSYESSEELARALENIWERVDSPAEMFIKLGKQAQLLLVRDGHLQTAIETYGEAKNINWQKKQDEMKANERRKEEARVRRADPNYVRPITQHTRKLIREKDKQCVFCGDEELPYHNRYYRLRPTSYKVEDVVLTCKSCGTKLKDTTPQEAGMTYKYGRFGKP